ncbi:hypothetical protein [Streptomyces rubellomurinus]|uniref:PLL-like beta propeller domain-containing protein n=1 Tax=Streptomyces sp. Y1 TaxID=3238634 RepID=A0AB39TUA2_9ACTN|nr:hypothetical protein [Streptomyces rubellomurinus]
MANQRPAVVSNQDGRLQVFVNTDGTVSTDAQTAPSNGWSGWQNIGGNINRDPLVSDPAAVLKPDGNLYVFAIGSKADLRTTNTTSPGGGWSGWQSLGGGPSGGLYVHANPCAVARPDGGVQVFAQGVDGSVDTIWVTAEGEWTGWQSLGSPLAGSPAAARNQDGLLQAFVLGANSADMQTCYQFPPSSPHAVGGWTPLHSLGGDFPIGCAGAAVNQDGRLEAFSIGRSNDLQHAWQTAPNDPDSWTGFASLGGGLVGDPGIGRNADGRLEAFGLVLHSAIHHIWQVSPGSSWSSWSTL